MRRIRLSKLNSKVSILGLALSLAGIGLLFSSRERLYGQSPDNRVPDLRGDWKGQITVVLFDNSLDPTEPPQFGQDEFVFTITHQNGRVFAGFNPEPSGNGEKLTGVLLPDGTVSMQVLSGHGSDRTFLTGTFSTAKGTYQMEGYAHQYEDVNLDKVPRILSAHFSAEKVN
ncbi:MAG: hypothetical protein NT090_26570 [Acidobacteria bacterium]|nr:hypothetical protein [Acidobacteriota bacterium]